MKTTKIKLQISRNALPKTSKSEIQTRHCTNRHSPALFKNWQLYRQVCSRRAPFFNVRSRAKPPNRTSYPTTIKTFETRPCSEKVRVEITMKKIRSGTIVTMNGSFPLQYDATVKSSGHRKLICKLWALRFNFACAELIISGVIVLILFWLFLGFTKSQYAYSFWYLK